jgi:hypothetical protein
MKIKCKSCKNDLDVFRERDSNDNTLFISPCRTCLKRAGSEGYNVGQKYALNEQAAYVRGQVMGL